MTINSNLINLKLLKTNIDKQTEYVSNGGYKTDLNMLIDKLNTDNELGLLNQSTTGIQKAQEINKMYDNIFTNLTNIGEQYKTSLLKLNSGGITPLDETNIQNELNKLKETFDKITNNKYDNENIFLDNQSKLFIGNNEFATRKMDNKFLKDINNIFIQIETTSDKNLKIEFIDKINELISTEHTKNGAEGNSLNNLSTFKENLKISTMDSFNLKHQNLEQNIVDLNSSINIYQSVLLMIKKMEDLSLVKYL
jgi:flagellin-like hook-associated protein FlgL